MTHKGGHGYDKNIRSGIVFGVVIAIICAAFVGFIGYRNLQTSALAENENTVLSLQIGNPKMTVDGQEALVDEDGTVPVIVNERTLLPVRAVIEAVDGTVDWDGDAREVTLTYGDDTIRLVIDSVTAYLNDDPQELDTAPTIINERTMLPIRFIAESFGFTVAWDGETETVTITVPKGNAADNTVSAEPQEASVVYMTTDISPESLVKIYEQLGFDAEGKTAVKMSTGESAKSNYLRPELIGDLIKSVDGTIVECNTAYGGSRATTAMHWEAVKERGLQKIADVDLMDEEGEIEIPIPDGTRIKEDIVGSHLANYDSMICLSHFKGHAMAGYGGAIKNMSIGVASSSGKVWIHSGGARRTGSIMGDQDSFLEAMGDATSGVINYMDGKIVYINVMNRLSVDCDCDGNPAEPEMDDIGILASYDPVALDQACLDLVYAHRADGAESLINRIESRNGLYTLQHAEEIGVGTRVYEIVSIDS